MNAFSLAVLLAILHTYRPPVVVLGLQTDTGMGKCQPFFSHFDNSDNLCHRDSDGSPLHVLPVPKVQK